MQNKRILIIIAALSVLVVCFGLWVISKPNNTTRRLRASLQTILIDHVLYIPKAYHVHDNYTEQLLNRTLIYRYSQNSCAPCYLEDIFELDELGKIIGRDNMLILPAYTEYDRNSRITINSEVRGLNYRNIPPDSLPLPINKAGEHLRYFAVIDEHGDVGMVFFPTRGRQDLTRLYFKEVERYFLELKVEN